MARDAVAGYVVELAQTREMLDARYGDVQSGKVKLIPGDEMFAKWRSKSETYRSHISGLLNPSETN